MKEINKIKLAKISGDMNDRGEDTENKKVKEWQTTINEIIEDERVHTEEDIK